MVTRTDCFSGVPSIRFSARRSTLLGAQLVDLAQQLFDAGADLFTVGLQGLHLVGEPRHLGAELDALLEGGLLLLAQTGDQLDRPLDAFFQATEGIGALFDGAHAFSRAAFAEFTNWRKAASSCRATSARTLRLSSSPAAFSPWTNWL